MDGRSGGYAPAATKVTGLAPALQSGGRGVGTRPVGMMRTEDPTGAVEDRPKGTSPRPFWSTASSGKCTHVAAKVKDQRANCWQESERSVLSNYTSRTDAMGYVCPLCDAGEGEKCKGVRGKLRESVHRDRMRRAARELGHHEIRTLTLEGNELVDASGAVLGRLVGVELDVQAADWGNLRRGDVAVDVPKTERSSPTTGGVGGGDTLFEAPDQVQLVFDHYRKVVKGKGNSRLSPETRRLIRKALAERPLELCLRAISGLAVSPHHNGQNDTGTEYLQIKYAIGKVRQTESVGDRIDLMASKAVAERADGKLSVEELLRSVPSDRHWIVRDLMSKAIAAIRQGRRDESSEERLKSLVGAGPIIDDGSFAGWERLA